MDLHRDRVAVEVDVFQRGEHPEPRVASTTFLVSVSVEGAHQRVIADLGRTPSALSRDPEFLRSTLEVFDALGLPPTEAVLDTTRRSLLQVASEIAARLSHRP